MPLIRLWGAAENDEDRREFLIPLPVRLRLSTAERLLPKLKTELTTAWPMVADLRIQSAPLRMRNPVEAGLVHQTVQYAEKIGIIFSKAIPGAVAGAVVKFVVDWWKDRAKRKKQTKSKTKRTRKARRKRE